ncbi:hypothetical protein FRACA_10120 [Frankia canadensis]|uniref:Uncharacterized protein n=1 Tax=Frankia canadensis TaxID=1836972 RepID=A0A2I2KI66_9ACTN|nr:hypothetical protein FRACA_10120 [Frankia canadensis]SOU52651.1 hypothetical protein FRACA_10120 [Frankia canadensis]
MVDMSPGRVDTESTGAAPTSEKSQSVPAALIDLDFPRMFVSFQACMREAGSSTRPPVQTLECG